MQQVTLRNVKQMLSPYPPDKLPGVPPPEDIDPEMEKVMETYGRLAFDSTSNVWGLWCSAQGGFYITYTTIKAMHIDVYKVILSESLRIENGI